MIDKSTINFAAIAAIVIFGATVAFTISAKEAFRRNTCYNKGYSEAFDTIQKIMDERIKDSTKVTRVIFETKRYINLHFRTQVI